MKVFNKIGLTALLVLASSFASANTYVWGDITSFTAPVYTEETIDTDVLAGSPGFFTDSFLFTLTEDNYFSVLATSTTASIPEFTKISFASATGVTGTLFNVFAFATLPGTDSIFLSAGDYSLDIEGRFSPTSTGYTINVVTSPVPEPSSVALMLGGLGLIGFMAARRKKV